MNNKLYDIWMRNYPQADVNISEEWGIAPCTLKHANMLIKDMETRYDDEDWYDHKMYKAKFYAEETGKYEKL